MIYTTKYLRIELSGENPKTHIYRVFANEDLSLLGQISWFAKWRQYAFMPASETVFEKTCLKDLSEFLEKINLEHTVSKDAIDQQRRMWGDKAEV